MIFGSVIRRAEHAVENIVDQTLARVIVAIPLLVAAGFATASASVFLNAKYGPELGHLIMASVFAAIGLVAAIVVSVKSNGKTDTQTAIEERSTQAPGDAAEAQGDATTPLTSSERELVNALLASAAPIAVPGLLRILLRNIPILLALLAAIFVMTRRTDDVGVPPAESAAST